MPLLYNDKDVCAELVPYCAKVEFGNGARIRVYLKGTVVLDTDDGALKLYEVLLVPSLAANLFSASRACSP